MIPNPIRKFIEEFSKLPSLGPRLATRLAFYLLTLDKAALAELVAALTGLKGLARCERCFFFTENKNRVCAICADQKRNAKVIAVVEKETDLLALERTGRFGGHYLILGELPEQGTLESAHKLRLAHLKTRIEKNLGGKLDELIVALPPSTFGDFAASLITEGFKGLAGKITRLGRGIPTGGEIEFTDEETLGSALERRY